MTLGLQPNARTDERLAPHHGFGFCFARCHLLEDLQTWLADLRAVTTVGTYKKDLHCIRQAASQALRESMATATVVPCRIRGLQQWTRNDDRHGETDRSPS